MESSATGNVESTTQRNPRRRAETLSSVRSLIGLHERPPIEGGHEDLEHQKLAWSRISLALREPFSGSWNFHHDMSSLIL